MTHKGSLSPGTASTGRVRMAAWPDSEGQPRRTVEPSSNHRITVQPSLKPLWETPSQRRADKSVMTCPSQHCY